MKLVKVTARRQIKVLRNTTKHRKDTVLTIKDARSGIVLHKGQPKYIEKVALSYGFDIAKIL
jgi:hypothetical protein